MWGLHVLRRKSLDFVIKLVPDLEDTVVVYLFDFGPVIILAALRSLPPSVDIVADGRRPRLRCPRTDADAFVVVVATLIRHVEGMHHDFFAV